MGFGFTLCQEPPSFVERKIPAYTPAKRLEPPAPLGTTVIEFTSMSSMPLLESNQVTPSLVDLWMPVEASTANRLTPLVPWRLTAKS